MSSPLSKATICTKNSRNGVEVKPAIASSTTKATIVTNRNNKSKVDLSKPKVSTGAIKSTPKRTSRRPSRSRKRKYSKKKQVRPVSYLDPAIWGPAGWTFLHAITFEFPERPTYEERLSMSMLMWSVADLLPCQQCCHEFTSVLEEYSICPDCPIIKGGRSVLAPWLVKVHNEVNERLNKPHFPYSRVEKLYYHEKVADCEEYKN